MRKTRGKTSKRQTSGKRVIPEVVSTIPEKEKVTKKILVQDALL